MLITPIISAFFLWFIDATEPYNITSVLGYYVKMINIEALSSKYYLLISLKYVTI